MDITINSDDELIMNEITIPEKQCNLYSNDCMIEEIIFSPSFKINLKNCIPLNIKKIHIHENYKFMDNLLYLMDHGVKIVNI